MSEDQPEIRPEGPAPAQPPAAPSAPHVPATPHIQVAIDCADTRRMARFWIAALGYQEPPPPRGHASWEQWATAQGIPESRWYDGLLIVDPDGLRPDIYLQKVPEPKAGKNRLHLDLKLVGRPVPYDIRRPKVEAEVARLESLGATVAWVLAEEEDQYCVVMRDPEGNEFCVY